MKNKYLLIAIIFTQTLLGQQPPPNCPPNPNTNTEEFCEEGKGISTNPDDLHNPECPDLKNNFDWRAQTPTSTEWYPVIGPNGSQFNIQNPFTGPNDAFYFPYVSAQQGSNYNPLDGWELLKVEFGTYGNIDANNVSGWYPNMPNGNEPKLPYMMLYNKYTGTLRFFGSLLDPHNTYKTIEIELRIPSESPLSSTPPYNNIYQSDLKATNLLSIQGKSVQPLDQETDETAISVFVKYTNNPNNFFWFDVPVAYDPCVCNNRVQLDVSFKFVQVADVEIEGDLNGSITTQSTGNVNYGVMVFNRILAAGISSVLAIKTGGAVVNVRAFTDLIDIITKHPNTSEEAKENLESLQDVLQCSGSLSHVIRDNYSNLGATDADQKKFQAANRILDANTTFLSSLATGCNTKDNAATTITGKIKSSGTVTQTDVLTGTRIYMALPGSKWNDFDLQFNDYPDLNGKVVSSYATYNERLGVFALLETPKVYFSDLQVIGDSSKPVGGMGGGTLNFSYTYKIINKLHLIDDLKYTFNPNLNLDLEKTQIQCRFVIRTQNWNEGWSDNYKYNVIYPADLNVNQWPNDNSFSTYNPNSLYPITSTLMPLEKFKNSQMLFSVKPKGHSLVAQSNTSDEFVQVYHQLPTDLVYLQIKILAVSDNIGIDGKRLESYHIYTFPVELIRSETQGITKEHYDFYQTNPEIKHPFMLISNMDIDFNDNDAELDEDITYTINKTYFYDGIVRISASLSTVPGVKIKIYSSKRIDVLPGAEIDPNIDLIIGYPFEKHPMPLASFEEVQSFCSSNNYKAQDFSSQARFAEQQEYQRQAEAIKKQMELKMKIQPNPNDGNFTLSLSKSTSKKAELTITTVSGDRVYHQIINEGEQFVEVNVSNLRNGMYFVTFDDGYNRLSQKFIVNKY